MGKWANNPPNDPRSPKIKSRQIKLQIGTDTNFGTGNSKIMIPKPENNGNHTQRSTPYLFNLDLAINENAQIVKWRIRY